MPCSGRNPGSRYQARVNLGCVPFKLLLRPFARNRATHRQIRSKRVRSVEKSAQRGRAKSAVSEKKAAAMAAPKPAKAGDKKKNGAGQAAAPKADAPAPAIHAYRSISCGALRKADAGKTVRLSGWVHRVRDHGGLLFIDLRDHYGLTQCVSDPGDPAFATAGHVRAEWVVRIDGKVVIREGDTVNPNLPTGEVEVRITSLDVLSKADELPLPVFGEPDYPEDTRLKYRFLDLRR